MNTIFENPNLLKFVRLKIDDKSEAQGFEESRLPHFSDEDSAMILGSSDFLGINWSGSDLAFMESLEEFMKVVIPQAYRAPQFAPEPPVFDNEKVKRDSFSRHKRVFDSLSSGRHRFCRDPL